MNSWKTSADPVAYSQYLPIPETSTVEANMFGKLVSRWCAFAGLIVLAVSTTSAVEEPDVVAQRLNELLAQETAVTDAPPLPVCDDATFLRRVFLDLLGEPPAPDDVLAFLWDTDPDKRRTVVDQLLADESFGKNWAGYWRDVIMYRRSEERALVASQVLSDYLQQQFNSNMSWDQIAESFVTAEGDVRENGATALIFAQNGQPEETVAEISRIFLGIQIQCAQCHDHPTDRWKREQFHQLAAFFPRVAVRPSRDGDQRSFLVVANDSPRMPAQNNPNNARRRGTPEHYMPDLDNPQARGTLMQPVFFATGNTLERGMLDAKRRGDLAVWITSPENPWFSMAFVNRIWSELCGEGFYEPVDDIGPDRTPTAPQTLDYLATQFTASDYDVKWLYRTIMATELYQRQAAPRRGPGDPPFQGNVAQPLRADPLLNCVMNSLGIGEGRQGPQGRGLYGMLRGPRGTFNQAFGYDPSVQRDEITTTIPQAQLLMNAELLNQAINQNRGVLAQLLREYPENDDTITQLYLRTLSRLPSSAEVQTCLAHVRQTGDRGEAMEDVLWSLMNSAEFSHRR